VLPGWPLHESPEGARSSREGAPDRLLGGTWGQILSRASLRGSQGTPRSTIVDYFEPSRQESEVTRTPNNAFESGRAKEAARPLNANVRQHLREDEASSPSGTNGCC